MNKQRRKALEELKGFAEHTRNKLQDWSTDIGYIRDEEQEAFDSMPESLQGSERGEQSRAAIDALDEALSINDSISEELDEVAGLLETAAE